MPDVDRDMVFCGPLQQTSTEYLIGPPTFKWTSLLTILALRHGGPVDHVKGQFIRSPTRATAVKKGFFP